MKKTAVRLGKFTIIGIILTLFNFLIYTLLARLLIKNNDFLWLASMIAYVLATILAYILHSNITWKERPPGKAGVFKFFLWNFITALIISPFFTWLFKFIAPVYQLIFNLSNTLHLPFDYDFIESTLIFVLVAIITMILNYLFYDQIVFRQKTTPIQYQLDARTTYLVSVIVPVYNTAKYLSRCLDSITQQTYSHLEIICINDGSTDQSAGIIKAYHQKDPRIKIINQKNQGLSSARNAGLKAATGKYITFVDSDDTIEPQMIESLLAAAISTHAEISICSFKEIFSNNKIKSFPHDEASKTYSTKSALRSMLKEENFNLTATMKLYQKSILRNLVFPVGQLHEDVGFTYLAVARAAKIVFIPHDYYIYHHHSESIVSSFRDEKFDLITLTDQMCDWLDTNFSSLKHATRERRMRARFSILRQIPLNHPRTKELLSYLKTNRTYITKNPEASTKDKLALRLAILNPRLFQLAYKLFK